MFSRLQRRRSNLQDLGRLSKSCPAVDNEGEEETSESSGSESWGSWGSSASLSDPVPEGGEEVAAPISRTEKQLARQSVRNAKQKEVQKKRKIEQNKISMDDYLSKQAQFKLWLQEEQKKQGKDLSSPKRKTYFKMFVRLWNKNHLPEKFYESRFSWHVEEEAPPPPENQHPSPLGIIDQRPRFTLLQNSPALDPSLFPHTIDLSSDTLPTPTSVSSPSAFSTFGKSTPSSGPLTPVRFTGKKGGSTSQPPSTPLRCASTDAGVFRFGRENKENKTHFSLPVTAVTGENLRTATISPHKKMTSAFQGRSLDRMTVSWSPQGHAKLNPVNTPRCPSPFTTSSSSTSSTVEGAKAEGARSGGGKSTLMFSDDVYHQVKDLLTSTSPTYADIPADDDLGDDSPFTPLKVAPKGKGHRRRSRSVDDAPVYAVPSRQCHDRTLSERRPVSEEVSSTSPPPIPPKRFDPHMEGLGIPFSTPSSAQKFDGKDDVCQPVEDRKSGDQRANTNSKENAKKSSNPFKGKLPWFGRKLTSRRRSRSCEVLSPAVQRGEETSSSDAGCSPFPLVKMERSPTLGRRQLTRPLKPPGYQPVKSDKNSFKLKPLSTQGVEKVAAVDDKGRLIQYPSSSAAGLGTKAQAKPLNRLKFELTEFSSSPVRLGITGLSDTMGITEDQTRTPARRRSRSLEHVPGAFSPAGTDTTYQKPESSTLYEEVKSEVHSHLSSLVQKLEQEAKNHHPHYNPAPVAVAEFNLKCSPKRLGRTEDPEELSADSHMDMDYLPPEDASSMEDRKFPADASSSAVEGCNQVCHLSNSYGVMEEDQQDAARTVQAHTTIVPCIPDMLGTVLQQNDHVVTEDFSKTAVQQDSHEPMDTSHFCEMTEHPCGIEPLTEFPDAAPKDVIPLPADTVDAAPLTGFSSIILKDVTPCTELRDTTPKPVAPLPDTVPKDIAQQTRFSTQNPSVENTLPASVCLSDFEIRNVDATSFRPQNGPTREILSHKEVVRPPSHVEEVARSVTVASAQHLNQVGKLTAPSCRTPDRRRRRSRSVDETRMVRALPVKVQTHTARIEFIGGGGLLHCTPLRDKTGEQKEQQVESQKADVPNVGHQLDQNHPSNLHGTPPPQTVTESHCKATATKTMTAASLQGMRENEGTLAFTENETCWSQTSVAGLQNKPVKGNGAALQSSDSPEKVPPVIPKKPVMQQALRSTPHTRRRRRSRSVGDLTAEKDSGVCMEEGGGFASVRAFWDRMRDGAGEKRGQGGVTLQRKPSTMRRLQQQLFGAQIKERDMEECPAPPATPLPLTEAPSSHCSQSEVKETELSVSADTTNHQQCKESVGTLPSVQDVTEKKALPIHRSSFITVRRQSSRKGLGASPRTPGTNGDDTGQVDQQQPHTPSVAREDVLTPTMSTQRDRGAKQRTTDSHGDGKKTDSGIARIELHGFHYKPATLPLEQTVGKKKPLPPPKTLPKPSAVPVPQAVNLQNSPNAVVRAERRRFGEEKCLDGMLEKQRSVDNRGERKPMDKAKAIDLDKDTRTLPSLPNNSQSSASQQVEEMAVDQLTTPTRIRPGKRRSGESASDLRPVKRRSSGKESPTPPVNVTIQNKKKKSPGPSVETQREQSSKKGTPQSLVGPTGKEFTSDMTNAKSVSTSGQSLITVHGNTINMFSTSTTKQIGDPNNSDSVNIDNTAHSAGRVVMNHQESTRSSVVTRLSAPQKKFDTADGKQNSTGQRILTRSDSSRKQNFGQGTPVRNDSGRRQSSGKGTAVRNDSGRSGGRGTPLRNDSGRRQSGGKGTPLRNDSGRRQSGGRGTPMRNDSGRSTGRGIPIRHDSGRRISGGRGTPVRNNSRGRQSIDQDTPTKVNAGRKSSGGKTPIRTDITREQSVEATTQQAMVSRLQLHTISSASRRSGISSPASKRCSGGGGSVRRESSHVKRADSKRGAKGEEPHSDTPSRSSSFRRHGGRPPQSPTFLRITKTLGVCEEQAGSEGEDGLAVDDQLAQQIIAGIQKAQAVREGGGNMLGKLQQQPQAQNSAFRQAVLEKNVEIIDGMEVGSCQGRMVDNMETDIDSLDNTSSGGVGAASCSTMV